MAARATVVYLEGPSHEGYSFALGRYDRLERVHDARHVYAAADGQHALWYAGDAWYLGCLLYTSPSPRDS